MRSMTTCASAAIFDLDGVLLDTEPLYTEATQTVLARYGKRYEPEHKRFVMGRSPLEGARWLVEYLGLPISAEQYLDERAGHLEQLFAICPCIPGAQALVTSLSSRGIRLALATSSERTLYELKVEKHAWFDAFEYVVCGDDPRLSRAKPAPDIFLLAGSALKVEPRECIVFEDSAAGVQAGVAAGMRVIARPQPPITAADVAQAHLVVSRYEELDLDRLFGGLLSLPRCDQ
jgi:pseudouridine-5'-monophosphatase